MAAPLFIDFRRRLGYYGSTKRAAPWPAAIWEGELLKKAVFFWIMSVVLAAAAVVGLLLSGGDGIWGILFLALLFLSLFGGGTTATITTLRAAGGKDASEKWLDANQWEKPLSLKHGSLSLYFNNQTGELAIFDRRESKKAPARILAYQEITNSGVYQENAKGKSSVQLVIQLVSGEPYVIAVTDGTPPPDSPEVQSALAFSKKVNELLSMMAFENAAGVEPGKRYLIAKCYNCGQLLHGEAGKSGWCPKCKADVRMPEL